MISTRELCQQVPVMPVLVVNDVAHAKPLAETLVAAGLHVLEVTLRTPVALEVIRIMSEVPGSIVGAGTVLTPQDVAAVKAAGAEFAVSPGATDNLLAAVTDQELPLLPGAVTSSEVMALMDKGYDMLKFFPAEAAGGRSLLKSLAGPLPAVGFCPTGGVNPENAADYLALANVLCVGGSWVTPKAMLEAGDWDGVAALARATHALRPGNA